MKRIKSLIILLLFAKTLFAEDLQGTYGIYPNVFYEFKNSNFNYYDYEKSTSAIKSGIFSIHSINNCDYLIIEYVNGDTEKFLCLHNDDYLVLYKNNKKAPIIAYRTFGLGESTDQIRKRFEVVASSELIEGKRKYSINNITNLNQEEPWVEGNLEDGIDEYIIIKNWKSPHMVFLSGFISYDKPYLFTSNNRPKKIEIEEVSTGKRKIVLLKDSPNPQNIFFEERFYGDIKIIIKEVYKGTKWKDTCINSILIRG